MDLKLNRLFVLHQLMPLQYSMQPMYGGNMNPSMGMGNQMQFTDQGNLNRYGMGHRYAFVKWGVHLPPVSGKPAAVQERRLVGFDVETVFIGGMEFKDFNLHVLDNDDTLSTVHLTDSRTHRVIISATLNRSTNEFTIEQKAGALEYPDNTMDVHTVVSFTYRAVDADGEDLDSKPAVDKSKWFGTSVPRPDGMVDVYDANDNFLYTRDSEGNIVERDPNHRPEKSDVDHGADGLPVIEGDGSCAHTPNEEEFLAGITMVQEILTGHGSNTEDIEAGIPVQDLLDLLKVAPDYSDAAGEIGMERHAIIEALREQVEQNYGPLHFNSRAFQLIDAHVRKYDMVDVFGSGSSTEDVFGEDVAEQPSDDTGIGVADNRSRLLAETRPEPAVSIDPATPLSDSYTDGLTDLAEQAMQHPSSAAALLPGTFETSTEHHAPQTDAVVREEVQEAREEAHRIPGAASVELRSGNTREPAHHRVPTLEIVQRLNGLQDCAEACTRTTAVEEFAAMFLTTGKVTYNPTDGTWGVRSDVDFELKAWLDKNGF